MRTRRSSFVVGILLAVLVAAPGTGAAAGPRWAPVTDPDVLGAGMLWHAVTLGDQVIALAGMTDRTGQQRLVTLATPDGAAWARRGTSTLTGSVDDLVVDGSALLAGGWDEEAAIWRSTDAGLTWLRPADASPFASDADGLPGAPGGASVAGIARGPAGLLAVGTAVDPDSLWRRAAAWRSSDGIAWERVPEVASLPPFLSIAADATVYVAVGISSGVPTSPPGVVGSLLRWSTDGRAWSVATAEVPAGDAIEGVAAVPGSGFVAWGSTATDTPGAQAGARIWSSADGRTWTRWPDRLALRGAHVSVVRVLEGGSLVMAVGWRAGGAFAWPLTGEQAVRRDAVKRRPGTCARDVASVRAILVAVGGRCVASVVTGRAWTSPLEP